MKNHESSSLKEYRFLEKKNGKIIKLSKAQLAGLDKIPSGNRFRTLRRKDTKGTSKDRQYLRDYPMVRSGTVLKIPFSGKSERIGYKTQKPEYLTEVLLKCSTNKGDLILDCFGGGGTTAAVASKLGRRFITGDVSPVATRVIAKRLNSIEKPPQFEILNVPRTKEDWLKMKGIEFEKKICAFMGWEWSGKGVNDSGVDGWANNKTIPIQIKNHRKKVGRPEIQKFVGSMKSLKEGIFVAWDFSPSSWDYRVEAKESFKKEIQFIKIEEILEGILIDMDKKMEIEKLYKEKIS